MITKTKRGEYRSNTPFVLKQTLEYEFPEIESVAQISERMGSCIIKKDGMLFQETRNIYADQEIFDILSIPFLKGNPAACLSNPASVVISEKIADKYFHSLDPINRSLNIKVGEQFTPFTVTGVLKNISQGSFFTPDIVLPKESELTEIDLMEKRHNGIAFMKGWNVNNPQTFILFKEKVSAESFKSKLAGFSKECINKGYDGNFEIQPLSKMHLYSGDIGGTMIEGGSVVSVLIFSTIGLLILFMGCINYINISIAQSVKRATEIGIRKVVGAGENQIRIQFLVESVLIAFMALPAAMVFLALFLPFGRELMNRHLEFNLTTDYWFAGGIIVLTFLVGIIGGSYNAFHLSRLQAIEVFKSKVKIRSSKSGLRRGLLTVQFIIFNVLIICSLCMWQQMYFIQHKQLGYYKEQLLSLNLPASMNDVRISAFKNEVMSISGIKNISICSFVPPGIGNWMGTNMPDPGDTKKTLNINYIISDLDYYETAGFTMKYGRFYTSKTGDFFSNKRLVLNDAAVHLLNIDSPVGKKISLWGSQWEIIGVLQDFHTTSLYGKIPPLFFFSTDKIDDFSAQFLSKFAIRIQAGAVPETMHKIEHAWNKFFPNDYFDYRFADDEFNRLHRNDLNLSRLLLIFTMTSIILSSMGLFGLISFMAQNRTKEIGIRKTFGASHIQIFGILTREFTIIFTISVFISVPVAMYFMIQWLSNFAYQANIGLFTFSMAIGSAFIIMLLTLSLRAIRAATTNPVDALRYE